MSKRKGLSTSTEPFLSIIIDFDSTIAETYYDSKLDLFVAKKPTKGVKKALEVFKSLRLKIIIFSCRNNIKVMGSKKNKQLALKEIKNFMEKYNLPYDEIDMGLEGKPLGLMYIDDRAVKFKNNWKEISNLLKRQLKGILKTNKNKFND